MRLLGRGRVPDAVRARIPERVADSETHAPDKRGWSADEYIEIEGAFLHPQHLRRGDVIKMMDKNREVDRIIRPAEFGYLRSTKVRVILVGYGPYDFFEDDLVQVVKAPWSSDLNTRFSQRDGISKVPARRRGRMRV